jgi:hypothetical protein
MAPSRSSSSKKGKGKATVELDANGRPPKLKRVKEVVYDADARKSVPPPSLLVRRYRKEQMS